MNTMAEAIKRIQEIEGLNDAELAKLVGIDASTIYRYKTGERNLGLRNAHKLIRVFPQLLDILFPKES